MLLDHTCCIFCCSLKCSTGYCFDALYGLTPAVYRHVFPFIKQLGFSLVATIPSAVWFEKKGKKYCKSGVISIIDRNRCNMRK